MSQATADAARRALDPAKFRDPEVTAKGEPRAAVPFAGFDTLWFNTGTLCNLTCRNCYIESSPTNDRLAYLEAAEVTRFLDELDGDGRVREIGFTGGEPFMNPDIVAMLADALGRGHRVLVLTNAMKPMWRHRQALLDLKEAAGDRLALRVSVDHYARDLHELERGRDSWQRMLDGLRWLAQNGFDLAVAGRTAWSESEEQLREGFARLFEREGIALDARDPHRLVLFPEMDDADVPEITTACWGILGVSPDAMMCATSRMVVRRRGEPAAKVLACTLLAYDEGFEMGATLAEAARPVKLNHPFCARFCVLGGGSCSAA
jgi:organic radical activating enzyme